MTTVNLRTIKIRTGEQFRDRRDLALEPVKLGGEAYLPVPGRLEAELTISRLSSGLLFELELEVELRGPCMRCLEAAAVPIAVKAREYQAERPGALDELTTPYLTDDLLDLSVWARDALALAVPEQVLCAADCAGLCAACGANLNRDSCSCPPPEPDSRWAKLAELRDRL